MFKEEANLTPCRCYINQPSILQPLHKYHGKKGITIPRTLLKTDNGKSIIIGFSEGEIALMRVPINTISKGYKE